MKFKIDQAILAKFPKAKIGYVIADIKNVKSHPYVEQLKSSLAHDLLETRNITKENCMQHPALAVWQDIFKSFGVKPKDYPASVNSLIKRVTAGKSIWDISSVVDLYNCHSVLGMLPMGGYDLTNIKGDIVLRFGNTGENFLALGADKPVDVSTSQVVYADDQQVMCWLWNYKDCQATMIKPETTKAVFFMDCADYTLGMPEIESTIQKFCADLNLIDCNVLEFGVVDKNNPEVSFGEEKKSLVDSDSTTTLMFSEAISAKQRLDAQEAQDLGIRDQRFATDENSIAIRSILSVNPNLSLNLNKF